MKKRIFFMPVLLIICIAVNLFVSCSPSAGDIKSLSGNPISVSDMEDYINNQESSEE